MWSVRASHPKYDPFESALNAATQKIAEYYDKTATSHAYTFAMRESISSVESSCLLITTFLKVLDPDSKMNHFKKHWDEDLQKAVLKSAEAIVGLNV